MKAFLLALLFLSSVSNAMPEGTQYCSETELAELKGIHQEMLQSPFFKRILMAEKILMPSADQTGLAFGDCMDPYSIEAFANMPHPMDMGRPFCGLVFTLNPGIEAQEGMIIYLAVSSGAKEYISRSGKRAGLCARLKTK